MSYSIWAEINEPQGKARDHFWFDQAFDGPEQFETYRQFADEVAQAWPAKVPVWLTAKPTTWDQLYLKRKGRPILGGCKTFTLPGTLPGQENDAYGFDDPWGWDQLAKIGVKCCRVLKADKFIFDCETSLELLYADQREVIWHKLRDALKPLAAAKHITWYWWGPRVLSSWHGVPRLNLLSKQLVDAIAEAVPNSVFIVDYAGWGPTSLENPANKETFADMRTLVGARRIAEIIYVRVNGRMPRTGTGLPDYPCYTVEEAYDLVTKSKCLFILYPGPDLAAVTSRWLQMPALKRAQA